MTENEISKIIVDVAFHVHQKLGLLINFGGVLFKSNVKRIVNGLPEQDSFTVQLSSRLGVFA